MARDNVTFDDLLFIARRVGVQVVAAPSSHRGTKGRMGTAVGITRHHTGTPETFKPTEDYPTYQVVKEGRPGLKNSLSAFGLGRHRAIYVFSEYLSWHAGQWLYAGITDGNGHFLGIEAEGTGQWTEWQKDIYPRLCASILLFIGEGVDMMPRHADGAMPRGRKTDAANLPADFVAKVANYLAHPELIPVNAAPATSEEDDMPRFDHVRDSTTGAMYLAHPSGTWLPRSPAYMKLYIALGLCNAKPDIDRPTNVINHLRAVYTSSETDDAAMAEVLAKLSADEER